MAQKCEKQPRSLKFSDSKFGKALSASARKAPPISPGILQYSEYANVSVIMIYRRRPFTRVCLPVSGHQNAPVSTSLLTCDYPQATTPSGLLAGASRVAPSCCTLSSGIHYHYDLSWPLGRQRPWQRAPSHALRESVITHEGGSPSPG